jgi:hypothetical protein
MDALAIIAKITGAVLLVWTAHSIFRHFTHRGIKSFLCPNSAAACAPAPAAGKKSSVAEHFLNHLLLYLWFIFLLAFSLGMILNN